MSSLFRPSGGRPDRITPGAWARRLQDRVAMAFFEHPEYVTMDFDDVRPLIFTQAELDRMRRTDMRIACLFLDATEWRPHVDVCWRMTTRSSST